MHHGLLTTSDRCCAETTVQQGQAIPPKRRGTDGIKDRHKGRITLPPDLGELHHLERDIAPSAGVKEIGTGIVGPKNIAIVWGHDRRSLVEVADQEIKGRAALNG